jgi:hypothetical protein
LGQRLISLATRRGISHAHLLGSAEAKLKLPYEVPFLIVLTSEGHDVQRELYEVCFLSSNFVLLSIPLGQRLGLECSVWLGHAIL